MSERVNQSLSAMMDDEVGEFELRKTLEQLDDDTVSTWSRYQVCRAAMRRQQPVDPRLDISRAVMAELEQQTLTQPHEVAKPSSKIPWRPLGSVAIAASVTMMVMFGAQTYQGGSNLQPQSVSAPPQVVLSAPTPINPDLMQAQFGQRSVVAPSLQQADVIRLSSSMQHYIDQHRMLTSPESHQWQAGWMPQGFSEVEHDYLNGSEVILYSNGETTISVSVQPYATRKASPGAVQAGDTVAVGKQVGEQFVTVVGEVPFALADRIASSISLNRN